MSRHDSSEVKFPWNVPGDVFLKLHLNGADLEA